MKILHITESSGFSGGVNQAIYLARILKEKGINCVFACPKNAMLREKIKDEFVFYDFSPKGSFDFKTIIELKKLFEKERFDIIHCHHPKAHNYSFWAKKISSYKPKIVVSRRVSYPIPTNPLAKIRYKSKDIDAYLAVSQSIAQMLINYGIEKERVFVVYSGVDQKRFRQLPKDLNFKKSLGLNEDDFVISHIANFGISKGHIYALKAFRILKEKGYHFKAIFAGMNTDGKELKDLSQKENVYERSLFLGFRDDIERILNITDISINSSIKGEALSGSIRESLACGVPVVASDISGNKEIVKDGINGFLFKPTDYMTLADRLERLLTSATLRQEFSQNALKTITERFTVAKMAQDTLEIYQKILQGS